ncbi:MAG: type IV secretory system conjugative DNA transfer family protein, partial [Fimbriimonadaceae bacterium]|nr:type IV secretory system conjugative DNA transfer family protein [Fimbriimonadaceae bacterium]
MLTNLFTTRPLRRLLATDTTLTPEASFEGKLLLIDMPLQEYHQAGRIAQFVWKYMWQKAALRRQTRDETRPIFLWCDESQNFISDFDPEFQAVARSAKACTVYLTQNISLYKKVLGTGSDDAVEAFLGNLQTKLFHQNSSSQTNQWASDLFAKDLFEKETSGVTAAVGSASSSRSVTVEELYQVRPIEFTRLKSGGPVNGGRVEAVMYKGGTVFNTTRRNWIKLTFYQSGYEPLGR